MPIKINDPDKQLKDELFNRTPVDPFIQRFPVFGLPFRPFFLLGALFAACVIGIWAFGLHHAFRLQPFLPSMIWHAHEMIFGFGAAIAVGFLLTAGQTWTGRKSVSGVWLALLVGLWLFNRVVMFAAGDTWFWVVLASTVCWWLLAFFWFARMVMGARNTRNYLFLPILLVMMSLDAGMIWTGHFKNMHLSLHVSRTAVFMFVILMTVLGGRVIPFFTHLGLQTKPEIPKTPLLDTTLLVCTVILAFVYGFQIELSRMVPFRLADALSGWFVLVGVLHLVRQSYWKPLQVWRVPLLWSLHLANFCVAIGLILIGIAMSDFVLAFSIGLHTITVGGMGGMILAMIARVSLGHTGRKLQPHRLMVVAFVCIFLSVVARALLPALHFHQAGWFISAGLWSTAFLLFVWVYFPILTTPRVDGKPG